MSCVLWGRYVFWVTSIENSDMLTARGVAGQNRNANNWHGVVFVEQCLMQCWPLYSLIIMPQPI